MRITETSYNAMFNGKNYIVFHTDKGYFCREKSAKYSKRITANQYENGKKHRVC